MAAGDDPLTLVRLDVAEMKGMLGQALSDHGQRLSNIETDNIAIHGRLTDKGKRIERHDERLDGIDEDVVELKAANNSRSTRVLGVLGAVAGLGALLLAVINRFTL